MHKKVLVAMVVSMALLLTEIPEGGLAKEIDSERSKMSKSGLTEIPSAYDAREEGLVTDIKDQGMMGNCWAFAAIGASEPDVLQKELEKEPDLSEYHLSYSAYNKALAPLELTEERYHSVMPTAVPTAAPTHKSGATTTAQETAKPTLRPPCYSTPIVKKLKFKPAVKSVRAGKKLKLYRYLKITRNHAGGPQIIYQFTRAKYKKYAKLSSRGVLKAKKAGRKRTIYVRAKAKDGSNKKAKIKIKIK